MKFIDINNENFSERLKRYSDKALSILDVFEMHSSDKGVNSKERNYIKGAKGGMASEIKKERDKDERASLDSPLFQIVIASAVEVIRLETDVVNAYIQYKAEMLRMTVNAAYSVLVQVSSIMHVYEIIFCLF